MPPRKGEPMPYRSFFKSCSWDIRRQYYIATSPKDLDTYRLVTRLVVDVDECTLDVRQLLDLHLQLLGHVVRDLEPLVAVHDHVDLDDVTRPAVVGTHRIDLLDVRRVSRR